MLMTAYGRHTVRIPGMAAHSSTKPLARRPPDVASAKLARESGQISTVRSFQRNKIAKRAVIVYGEPT